MIAVEARGAFRRHTGGELVLHCGVQHVVAVSWVWTTPAGVRITEWEARCGASGESTGRYPFSIRTHRLRMAACRGCAS